MLRASERLDDLPLPEGYSLYDGGEVRMLQQAGTWVMYY